MTVLEQEMEQEMQSITGMMVYLQAKMVDINTISNREVHESDLNSYKKRKDTIWNLIIKLNINNFENIREEFESLRNSPI
jgi:hypothetical protein